MARFPGQIRHGDRDRYCRITAEERIIHLPAQPTKGIDGSARIAQPQGRQVRPGDVAHPATRSSDRHHHGNELGIGVRKGQRGHVAEQRARCFTLWGRQEEARLLLLPGRGGAGIA
ncbi:hypothetical protein [Streptomyces sp. NPDC089799]|uniref:hypothetical protein n=1 Tax=Streptomyces sp. NPDC089799 TaxID=3155066 RepID=UPI003431E687